MLAKSKPAPEDPNHVFLCHFGGPESEEQVSTFLINLFEDPLIIRAPLGRFRQVLARRITKKRLQETIAQYKKINFSPINHYTRIQAEQLQTILRKSNENTHVHVVNRYTQPFAKDVVKKIDFSKGRFFAITLYPHFCHSTSASSLRELDQAISQETGEIPLDLTHIYSWWAHEGYFDLTLKGVCDQLKHIGNSGPIAVLFSAHGIPRRYAEKGDPYGHEIRAHFERIAAKATSWSQKQSEFKDQTIAWFLSFQSRVGRVEWLKPYTEEAITSLAKQGFKQLLMVPISFVSDHIETLFEMDVTYRNLALDQGFVGYHRVAGLNESPELTQCLADILVHNGL